MNENNEKLRLVHIYMGNGKGKTTAALGLAIRAVGWKMKVGIIQFMKGWPQYGELASLSRFPEIKLIQTGRPDFVDKKAPLQIDIDEAHRGLAIAREWVEKGLFDLVILDEINVALDYEFIELKDVISLLQKRSSHVELVLTGRNPPKDLLPYADLITEMKEIRHPYTKGILGRKGFDY